MNNPDDSERMESHGRHAEPPGRRLRDARKTKGLTQQDVAARLRLSIEVIDALEHDAFDRLPEPLFVRGYLRSYAAILGLTPDELIDGYEAAIGSFEPPPLVVQLGRGQVSSAHRAVRYATYAIGAALIVLVAVWWRTEGTLRWAEPVAQVQEDAEDGTASAQARPGAPVAPAERAASVRGVEQRAARESTPPPRPTTVTGPPARGGRSVGPEGARQAPEPVPDMAPEPRSPAPVDAGGGVPGGEVALMGPGHGPEAAEPAAPTPPDRPSREGVGAPNADPVPAQPSGGEQAPAAEAPTPAGEIDRGRPPSGDATAGVADTLTLDFQEASWAEVRDASGERLMYRLGRTGETQTLRGEAPFEVFLGNAPGVKVELNAEAFDTGRYTRSNKTARFTIEE